MNRSSSHLPSDQIERWLVILLWGSLAYVLVTSLIFPVAGVPVIQVLGACLLALIPPIVYVSFGASRWQKFPWPFLVLDIIITTGIYHMTGGARGTGVVLAYCVLGLWAARFRLRDGIWAALFLGVVFVWPSFLPAGTGSITDLTLRMISFIAVVVAINFLSSTTRRLERQVSEEKSLREESNQRTRELSALRDVTQQLTSSLDLQTVLNVIGDSSLRLVQATDVHIFLYDEKLDTFSFGIGVWAEGRRTLAVSKPRADGLSARVIRDRRPVVVNDAHHDPLYSPPPDRASSILSIAGFPLKRGDHVIGVLNVSFDHPHTFLEDEQRTLVAFADQAALAVENARLYQDARTNLEHVTRLYGLSTELASSADPAAVPGRIVHAIADAMNAPIATIALMNDATGQLEYAATIGVPESARSVPFRPEGTGMTVYRTGEPRYVEDVQWSPDLNPETRAWMYRAVAALPMQHAGKTLGVLYVNYADPHEFTPTEKNMLTVFANQAAIALDNARLFSALGHERNLLRTLIDHLPDSVYVKDTEGRYIVNNKTHTASLRYQTPDLLYGKTVFDVFPQELADIYHADDTYVLQTGESILNREEPTTRRTTGLPGLNLTTKVPLRDSTGKIVGLLGISRDITESKKTQEALARERALLRAILDVVPDYIYVKDRESRYVLNNQAHLRSLGAESMEQTVGKTSRDFYPSEFAQQYLADEKQIIESGKPIINKEERVWNRTTGGGDWHLTTKVPMRDAHGQVTGLVGITRDITESKLMQDALRESEEKYRTILTSIEDGYYEVDLAGNFTFFNDALLRLYEYSRDELMGLNYREYMDAETAKLVYQTYNTVYRTGKPVTNFEWEFLSREGARKFVQVSVSLMHGPDGEPTGFRGMIRDVSERKRAEAAIQASETRFRALFENAPDAIVLIDPNDPVTPWAIVDCNDSFVRMNGYSKEELIGQCIDIMNLQTGTEAGRADYLAELRRAGQLHVESSHRRKDGALITIETVTALITIGGRELVLGIDRDVTELRKTERDILRRNEELKTLNEVGQSLSRLAKPSEILEIIYEMIGRVLDNRNLYIALYDEPNNYVSFPIYLIDGKRQAIGGRKLGNGLTEYVIFTKAPLLIPDDLDAAQAGLGIALHGDPACCYLAVPMLVGEKVIGVIAVQDYERARVYDEQDMQLLMTLASQAAIALENAHLFEETRRQLQELGGFHELATAVSVTTQVDVILERICSVIGDELYPDNFGFIFVDESTGNLYTHSSYRGLPGNEGIIIPAGSGITGNVVRTGEVILCKDTTQDERFVSYDLRGMRSELCVPLRAGEKIIGVLNAESLRPDAFTERDLRFFQTLASQIGTVIENARLFDDMQRRVRELTVLNQVAAEGARAQDMDTLLTRVVSVVAESVYPEDFGFLLLDSERQVLRVHPSYHGIPAAMRWITVPVGQGISGWVAEHGEPVCVGDTQDDARYIGANTGMHSELSVPLCVGDRVIGVVNAESQRLNAFSDQDLRFLSTLAGQVAVAIQNIQLFEDVQRWAEELEKRVEERTEALTQANQRLQEADRVKSQFLANMSHELRTPMNAVIGYTELLLENTYGPLTPQQQDRLTKVVRNAKSLLQLINDILDISKIEAGRMTLNISPTYLRDVVTASLQTVEPLVREKKLQLQVQVDSDLPRVPMDETRIKQVVDNLLSNAVKFTDRGTVAIRATCWKGNTPPPVAFPETPPDGDWIIVSVADTGIGIPLQELTRVFEAFRQADSSTTRKYGGTGLGLAIARELIEMHGGQIWAESILGSGSTFYFTLPLKGAPSGGA